MATTSAAAGLLGRQFKQMQTDKDIPGISCGLVDNNIFEWEVMLMINDDCKYYGGTYRYTHIPSQRRGNHADEPKPHRRILPRTPLIPPRIPPHATQDEVRDPDLPPQHLRVRRCLHLHSTPARRRQIRIRIGCREVVARPVTRVHLAIRHQHVERS